MDEKNHLRAKYLSEICSIFSNGKRIEICWALLDGDKCSQDIALAINTSAQNTSQHLRLLKSAGFVRSQRDGHCQMYSLVKDSVSEKCPYILKAFQIEKPFERT